MQRVHGEAVFESKDPAWRQFLQLPTPDLPNWWHARSAHTLRKSCRYHGQAHGSGGVRSNTAESRLIKHQPPIDSRSHERASNRRTGGRISSKCRGRPGRLPVEDTLLWAAPYSGGCVTSNSPLTRQYRQGAAGIRQRTKAEETGA